MTQLPTLRTGAENQVAYYVRLARMHSGLVVKAVRAGDPKLFHYHRGCRDMAIAVAKDQRTWSLL